MEPWLLLDGAAQGVRGSPSLEVLHNRGDVALRDVSVGMVGWAWGSEMAFPTVMIP